MKVVFVGNPNVGKTTLINKLSGGNLKVGNWAGTTLERLEASLKLNGKELKLIDLPGVYSLEGEGEAERVCREFLNSGEYDLIVNVLDSTQLERDLYLTTQLLYLKKPIVLVLNMIDVAKSRGIKINDRLLSEILGLPVLKVSGRTGYNLKELLNLILKPPRRGRFFNLEGEENKFRFVERIYREVVKEERNLEGEALDRVFLNPFLGLFSFTLLLLLSFKIIVALSTPLIDFLSWLFTDYLTYYTNWGFLRAILSGVGFALSFIPIIFLTTLFISLLEMSGIIPRLAYLFDSFMHRLGIHGSSVLPMLLAFGCNVPAILSAKIVGGKRERLITVLMIPFVSCSARFVVFSSLSVLFFERPEIVLTSLYLLGIGFALLTGFLLNKIWKGKLEPFFMEIPPYRIPDLKLSLRLSLYHTKNFLKFAGSVIFLISLILYSLMEIPNGRVEDSLLRRLGEGLTFLFEPIGLDDWRITTALIPALLTRETIPGTLGVLFSQGERPKPRGLKDELINTLKGMAFNLVSFKAPLESSITKEVRKALSPKKALSFMLFILLYTSCLATITTMAKLLGWKVSLLFFLYSFILGYGVSFTYYNLIP